MLDREKYLQEKNKARKIYNKTKSVICPYFDNEIIFNSDGFHHLSYSARRERNKDEQILKFRLLPLAIKIIQKTGTLQEYRADLIRVGKKSHKDNLARTKKVEYWGFIAIAGRDKKIKIRVILRRIGDGNIIFWSVMPYGNIKSQRLYTIGIEDQ